LAVTRPRRTEFCNEYASTKCVNDMNPARSLAPALVYGGVTDLWLYWSATFVGTTIIEFALRKRMLGKMKDDEENNIKV
jgi:major intrinsic protein